FHKIYVASPASHRILRSGLSSPDPGQIDPDARLVRIALLFPFDLLTGRLVPLPGPPAGVVISLARRRFRFRRGELDLTGILGPGHRYPLKVPRVPGDGGVRERLVGGIAVPFGDDPVDPAEERGAHAQVRAGVNQIGLQLASGHDAETGRILGNPD